MKKIYQIIACLLFVFNLSAQELDAVEMTGKVEYPDLSIAQQKILLNNLHKINGPMSKNLHSYYLPKTHPVFKNIEKQMLDKLYTMNTPKSKSNCYWTSMFAKGVVSLPERYMDLKEYDDLLNKNFVKREYVEDLQVGDVIRLKRSRGNIDTHSVIYLGTLADDDQTALVLSKNGTADGAYLILSLNELSSWVYPDSNPSIIYRLKTETFAPDAMLAVDNLQIPENKSLQKIISFRVPKLKEKKPLVIVLHGGNGEMSDKVAEGTARAYIKAWLPYRNQINVVAPTTTWGWGYNGLAIVQNAILWAKKNPRFNIDENKIFLWGQSMGGHGSWRSGLWLESKVAGIIPICGGYDFGDKLSSFFNLPIYHIQGNQDPLFTLKDDALKNAAWFDLHNKEAQSRGEKQFDYTFKLLEGGHDLFEAEIPNIIEWMKNKTIKRDPNIVQRNWDANFVMGWRPDLFNMSSKETEKRPELAPINIARNYWFEPTSLEVSEYTAPTSYKAERIVKNDKVEYHVDSVNIKNFKIYLSNKFINSEVKVFWNGKVYPFEQQNKVLIIK